MIIRILQSGQLRAFCPFCWRGDSCHPLIALVLCRRGTAERRKEEGRPAFLLSLSLSRSLFLFAHVKHSRYPNRTTTTTTTDCDRPSLSVQRRDGDIFPPSSSSSFRSVGTDIGRPFLSTQKKNISPVQRLKKIRF